MAEIDRRLYASWDEFSQNLRAELFGSGPFQRDRYLFRGVSDADWELVSSFDRQFPDIAERQSRAAELLQAFREACEGEVDGDVLSDPDRLSALAQHHGLPTRLLDWTWSPFVAAFFALAGALRHTEADGRHVAVWALHLGAGIWNAETGVTVVPCNTGTDARMRNQGGCFTRSLTPFRTLEEYVAQMPGASVGLTQFAWPALDAERGLAELEMMGIDSARLFPGLDGAAQGATMRIRLRHLAA